MRRDCDSLSCQVLMACIVLFIAASTVAAVIAWRL